MLDMFAGAGGSSTGAVATGGIKVITAMNHWDRALETHNANHPDTDHIQADISQYNPRLVPATDILWASPECTFHSRARGGRDKAISQPDLFGETLPSEAAQRSRATMWDPIRFAEWHQYRAVIIENVIEIANWPPFHAWLHAWESLGYQHRIVSMNSMHAQAHGLPAPQSRDRIYVVLWRKGERAPDLENMQRPKAHCPSCGETVDAVQSWKNPNSITGRYRAQYVYRCPKHSCRGQIVEPGWLPASSFIDWSNPGTRIGDRGTAGLKPLADKTLRRIQAGIERYWSPLTVEHGGNNYDAADPKHPSFGDPDGYYRAWPTSTPVMTLPARETKALAMHAAMIPVEGRDGKQPFPATAPMRTQSTRSETGVAFPPLISEMRGGGSIGRPANDPLSTVSAGGNHHALVMSYYSRDDATQPAAHPIQTVTTEPRHALMHRMNSGGAWLTTPTDEPTRTLTAGGHQAILRGGSIDIDDVYFRMLEPSEIKEAMAFPADYIMTGTRREQVKQSGNAVTPPAARDLIRTVAQAITGEAA